jgi:hypothetical protein
MTPHRQLTVDGREVAHPPSASAKGRSSRTKGKVAELEVVHILQEHGWPEAERTSRGRAQYGSCDIRHGPQGCAIEVKRQEKLNVPKALDQLAANAMPGQIPLLIHRPSRHRWMVTLPLEDLLALLGHREREIELWTGGRRR